MKTFITAFAAGVLLLAAPVQAQDQESASSSAAPVPQSQGLTDLETALMAVVNEGDKAYDQVNADVDAKAGNAMCPHVQSAYTAYLNAYNQFQGVIDGIEADTVLPAANKPDEQAAVNDLWMEIEFYLEDLEDLASQNSCTLT